MEYRLGIDLGGTGIKLGVVDSKNQILVKHSVPTGAERPFPEVAADMARAAREAAAMAGLSPADFACVGVGAPGQVSRKTRLVFATNLHWTHAPLGETLEQALGTRVFVGNDADCAVVGEAVAGAAAGRSDVLMLTLGTGVGGGALIGGKLFSGGDGMGAEFGHTPFCFGGRPCSCGGNGCLEAYASVTALIEQTAEAMQAHPESCMHAYTAEHGGHVGGRTAFDCAKLGDPAALEVVTTYFTYLAAGIGGFVSVLRPEIVLIGGGLSNEKQYLTDPVNAMLPKYVFAGSVIGVPPVVTAVLGNDAGILGAAHLDHV